MTLSLLLSQLQSHPRGSLPWQCALHQMISVLQADGVGVSGGYPIPAGTDDDDYAIALQQTWLQFCQPQQLSQLSPDRMGSHFQALLRTNLERRSLHRVYSQEPAISRFHYKQ